MRWMKALFGLGLGLPACMQGLAGYVNDASLQPATHRAITAPAPVMIGQPWTMTQTTPSR